MNEAVLTHLKNKLKQNSYNHGAVLAFTTPFLSLVVIYYLLLILAGVFNFRPFQIEQFYLLSIIGNLFLMRYYLVELKYTKTGKGILAVTFMLIIAYFILFYKV
jgi:hypothetical protein